MRRRLHLARIKPLPARLPANALVIVSGVVGTPTRLDDAQARAIIDWLAARQPADGFTLMTVCAGALFAAAAGLTRGRECTTHHGSLAQLAALDPSARILDNRIFVEDGALVSSAASRRASISRCTWCRATAARASPARSPVKCWSTNAAPARIRPCRPGWNTAVICIPASTRCRMRWCATRRALVGAIAGAGSPYQRAPTRLFRLHAGCTPMDYLYQIRVALARDLLRETRLDLERVAEKAGFGSAQHMRRVWRRFEPRTPGMARQQLAA